MMACICDGQCIAAVLLRLLSPARALPTVIKRGNRRPKPIADSGNGGGSETVSCRVARHCQLLFQFHDAGLEGLLDLVVLGGERW